MDVKYDEIAVDKAFIDYIQKFWVLDNSQNPIITQGKYALPNGSFTVAFILGNGVIVDTKDNVMSANAGVCFVGQISKRAKITLRPYTKAIMVQLKPWTAALITNFPLSEATDLLISFDLINKSLHQAFISIDLFDQRVVVQTFYRELANYLRPNNDSNFIKSVFSHLGVNTLANPTRVSDIAITSGYSERRVEQKFSNLIGLSPKEIQKILQLRGLINELTMPNNSSLSYLTHKYGYYDQSHFIKSYNKIMYDIPSNFDNKNYILPFQ